MAIDSMAEKYSMLPSQILDKATTVDLMIHVNASVLKLREQRKSRGENITDTFSQHEISERWNQWNQAKGNDENK